MLAKTSLPFRLRNSQP